MSSEMISLTVFRYDPDKDEAPRYVDYQVPWSEGLIALKALKYVRENFDETLAFRDFCCGCSWCMSCLMMINGQGVRACSWLLKPGDKLLIEPMKGNPIIKDLVVDFGVTKTTSQGAFKRMEGAVIKKMDSAAEESV